MTVETGELVKEIPVIWKPKGYEESVRIIALIRNDRVTINEHPSDCGLRLYLAEDPEGCRHYLDAIEDAKRITTER